MQHDCVAQDLGDAPRARRVALDDLDLVAVLDALREPEPDVAATRDHDALDRVVDPPQLHHDLAHVLGGGEENTSSSCSITVSPSGAMLLPAR